MKPKINNFNSKKLLPTCLIMAVLAFVQLPCLSQEIVRYSVQSLPKVSRGKEFQVDVTLHIQPGWYVYAPNGVNASMGLIETSCVLQLTNGFQKISKFKFPDPEFKNGHAVYEGDSIIISQKLLVNHSTKDGKYEIKGKLKWQCCNADICLAPNEEDIIVPITIE